MSASSEDSHDLESPGISLDFHLAENLYFWINLANSKDELNEKI